MLLLILHNSLNSTLTYIFPNLPPPLLRSTYPPHHKAHLIAPLAGENTDRFKCPRPHLLHRLDRFILTLRARLKRQSASVGLQFQLAALLRCYRDPQFESSQAEVLWRHKVVVPRMTLDSLTSGIFFFLRLF